MSEEHILHTYESIAHLTARMLDAARAAEWDALVGLERDCSALFARLFAADTRQPRSPEFQQRKATLIRGVLADDAQIRSLVEPWLNQLAKLLNHTGQERRLAQAYQAGE
jgi:flagellar protein FliT